MTMYVTRYIQQLLLFFFHSAYSRKMSAFKKKNGLNEWKSKIGRNSCIIY